MAMVALNLPLNIVLVLSLKHVAGLALSTTICACIQSVLLAILLRRRFGLLGRSAHASFRGADVNRGGGDGAGGLGEPVRHRIVRSPPPAPAACCS